MPSRLPLVLALLAALGLAACQNPDGSTDYGRSVLGGALAGAGAGLVGGVVNDIANSQRGPAPYGYGYPVSGAPGGPGLYRRF